jgi:[ribosomal protein S5]-alanine N-acetyltransferase
MGGLEILHTERLVLRRLHSASEIAALLDLWTDPDVTQFMGGPRNREDLQADFQATLEAPERDAYDLWPLLERDTLRLVGHCGLLHKDVDGHGEIELVYVIAQSEWGQGYASEIAYALSQHAFKNLGLTRLVALIDPDNLASERVAAKIGMRFERDVVRPGGAIRLVYAAESTQTQTSPLLSRLKYGAASWNLWRRANPDVAIVLDKADLSGLILTGVDFSGVSLRGATLHATNLMNADLRGADLSDANLTEADLIAARLDDTILIGANLREADLLGSDLTNARFRPDDLRGALHVAPNAQR